MRVLTMIALASAVIASSTCAFAGELPSYEVKSLPISAMQVQVLGGAGVEEQSTAPAMIVAGMSSRKPRRGRRRRSRSPSPKW